jgi:hypothetical protein
MLLTLPPLLLRTAFHLRSKSRKLLAAAVEASMATAETQALDDDIALLAAMQSGDGDAHDHFTNNGGRRYCVLFCLFPIMIFLIVLLVTIQQEHAVHFLSIVLLPPLITCQQLYAVQQSHCAHYAATYSTHLY